VNARDQIGAKGCMHGTVALDAAHGGKLRRADHDVEMRLAGAIIARMAGMALAVIDHFQLIRRKSLRQFVMNLVYDWHISVNPLQSAG
jgi:hypothetical protein